ncbi:LppA family lipoprotein [Nocardia sp. alder85J]|uniref:LppA family lipoprotein n=1 Tax=Nocardia sp. alder85J TaxID=2862949 RepID=UPI0021070F5C|nr:LppA family lipoprotein [Nocardia sp. alder85J]MCX4093967.1 LppA family lipoprotein [Nocardia sp. alder85J]
MSATCLSPDDVWPHFVERSRAIAAAATAPPESMQDRLGHHDMWFSNPEDGTMIQISSQAVGVIAGTVGCHLPQAMLTPPTTAPHPTS